MKKSIFGIIFVLVFIFSPAIFQGKMLYYGDNLALSIPTKVYFVNQVRSGEFPWWNPYIMGGTPFFADLSNSSLYPATVLFFIFSPAVASNAYIFLHILWGAMGLWYLQLFFHRKPHEAFLGILTWMISGTLFSVMSNMSILASVSWMPWMIFVILKTEFSRKAFFLVPVVLFFSFISGHPQPFILSCIFSAVFVFSRYWKKPEGIQKDVLIWMLSAVLTIGLLALYIGPFFELASNSTRTMLSVNQLLEGSFHPALWINLGIPNFFSNPSVGMAWGPEWGSFRQSNVYVGLVSCIAVIWYLFSKRRRDHRDKTILFLMIFSMVFAFAGDSTINKFLAMYEIRSTVLLQLLRSNALQY